MKMLNTGADSVIVSDQSVLSMITRDSVTFKSTNPDYNSESMERIFSEVAAGWQGGMSQDVTVAFDQDGVYVYQCTPHLMMA